MSDVDAEAHAGVHVADRLEHIVGRGKVLVLRPVVVDRDLDVVLLRKALHPGHDIGVASADDRGHPRRLGVLEIPAHIVVGIDREGDRSASDDPEPRCLNVLAQHGELGRRLLVGEVHGLEVDVRRAQRPDHLERFVEREFAQRIACHPELHGFGDRGVCAARTGTRWACAVGLRHPAGAGDAQGGPGNGGGRGFQKGAARNSVLAHLNLLPGWMTTW